MPIAYAIPPIQRPVARFEVCAKPDASVRLVESGRRGEGRENPWFRCLRGRMRDGAGLRLPKGEKARSN